MPTSAARTVTRARVRQPGFGQLVWLLAGKLGLTFLLIVLPASYLSFGLAHRLVRAELGDLPVEPEKQRGMLGRMRGAAWLAVAITVWVSWMGLRLTQALHAAPPGAPPPRTAP